MVENGPDSTVALGRCEELLIRNHTQALRAAPLNRLSVPPAKRLECELGYACQNFEGIVNREC
jgi:hypothetical protein